MITLLKIKISLHLAWTQPGIYGDYFFLLHFLKLYLEKSYVLCFVKEDV